RVDALKSGQLLVKAKGLQNLYTSVRFRPAPPAVSGFSTTSKTELPRRCPAAAQGRKPPEKPLSLPERADSADRSAGDGTALWCRIKPKIPRLRFAALGMTEQW